MSKFLSHGARAPHDDRLHVGREPATALFVVTYVDGSRFLHTEPVDGRVSWLPQGATAVGKAIAGAPHAPRSVHVFMPDGDVAIYNASEVDELFVDAR